MPAEIADAPDIAALGTAPVIEPAVPETDPFKDSVRTATKDLPTPDAVEQEGVNAGRPPEQIATALQKLRADAAAAYQTVADDNAEHADQAFQRRDRANEDFNNRIAQQRQQATARWAQGTFENADQFKQFATTYDHDPAQAAQQNPQAAQSLNAILSHPAFQEHHTGPAFKIKSPEGDDFGWAQAHPDMRGGYDVHVNLGNGKGSGSFKVAGKATKADAYKAFTESKIGKKAGEFHPIKGALSETAYGLQNIAASILDKIPGFHDDSVEWRQRARVQHEKNAHTTAPGMLGEVTRQTEQLAGKLPIWMLPAGLPAEMWSSAEARGKNMADDLADQAFKEPDAARKNLMVEQSNHMRDNAAIYGAASAATGLAAGKLLALPFQGVLKLLPASFQKAFADKVTSLGGTVAAETANITAMELIQGQVVDPVFGFERAPLSNLINPGNLLFGAVFGGKRYRAAAKERAMASTAKDVAAGKITSPQQIFDAIHGKAEDTEPTVKVSGIDDGLTAEPVMEGDVLKDFGVRREGERPAQRTSPPTTQQLANRQHPYYKNAQASYDNDPNGIPPDVVQHFGLDRSKELPKANGFTKLDVRNTQGGFVSSAWFDALAHGADLIHQGFTDFAKWGREMVSRFGAAIQPHLKALWKGAVQYYYDVILPARGSIAAPGGHIAQPARQFQSTALVKEKGFLDRINPRAVRARQKEAEPVRQVMNEHNGEISAGNLAFDALQKQREKEAASIDRTKFEKDSLLGAAIHVWRQVKGDQSILTDQRDQLKSKGGDQYLPVWEKALKLTPEEKAMSAKVTEDYKQNAVTAQAAGLAIAVDEAYGKQIWDRNKNHGKAGFGEFLSRFDADPSSFKKKKHATSFDGIMAGLTPMTLDDFKLVSVNGKEVNRAVATRKLAQKLPELRDSKGRPFAIIDSDQASKLDDNAVQRLQALAASGVSIPVQMRSYTGYDRYAVGGDPVTNFDPTGYKPAGGRGIEGYYYQLPAAAGGVKNYWGRLLFSPEAFPYVNARTAPSWVREVASRPNAGGYTVSGILFLNREIKASLLGALSAFHYVQEGFHGLGHATNPLWNLPPVDPLNPEHLQWMKSGLMLGGEHDAIKYFDGGGDLDALFYRVPVLGYLSKKMSEHLFMRYIPALKLKTAQNAYGRNRQRFAKQLANGTMNDAEVRHITATAVNDAYGHINWGDLGIGKSMRDFLQVACLAPDFLIARARFAAQALGVQKLRGVDASRAGREAFMAFFALAVGQWMTARMANWLLNDGDMRTDAKDLFAVVNKKTGQRFSLRSVPGDVLEAVERPVEFFNNRASPLVRDFYNVVMGTNWRGEQVGHSAALADAVIGAAPMTAQPLLRDFTTTGQQAPTSRAEDWIKAVGIKVNRWSQLGEAKARAHEYMKTHGAKTGTDYHQPSVYNPLLFRLLDKDENAAAMEVIKLTGGDRRQMDRIVKGFQGSLFRNFTGDAAHEVNFRRELSQTDEGKQLLKDADRQRIEAWNLFLRAGRVSGDLRAKHQGKLPLPSNATQTKARELRLVEARR